MPSVPGGFMSLPLVPRVNELMTQHDVPGIPISLYKKKQKNCISTSIRFVIHLYYALFPLHLVR